MNEIDVSKHYFDPKTPASFTTIGNFIKNNKQFKDKKFVHDVLSDLKTYGMFAPVKRTFKRRRVVESFPRITEGCDLADLSRYAKTPGNKNTHFLCIFIDIFSKFMPVYPMKSKNSAEMLRVVQIHLSDPVTRPMKIWMDKEKAMYSKPVLEYLKSINVKLYSTGSPIKSAFAENAVKVIKSKISKWMHYTNSKKYIPILQDLVDSYNNTVNSATKFKPVELLSDSDKISKAWHNQYKHLIDSSPPNPKLSVGQYVRIANSVILFRKGYEQSHSEEIFKVNEIILTESVPMYRLVDLQGEKLASLFYENQLFVVPSIKNTNVSS
jgi:hypothetical protein